MPALLVVRIGYRQALPAEVLTQLPPGALMLISGPRSEKPTLVPTWRRPVTPMTPAQLAGTATAWPALLPAGPVTLALRLGAPLVPVRTERLSDNRALVVVYPPVVLTRSGDLARDVQVGTQQVAHILEEMIRQTPEQWILLQPVWPEDGGPALPPPAAQPALA